MRLRAIRIRGWRNLETVTFSPGPRVTVFHGDNGQGKTNFLEAAYFLAEFRSWRTKTAPDLVQWGQQAARLDGQVEVGGLDRKVEIEVAGGRKTTRVDGKTARRDATSLRGLAVVLFVPEDLQLPRAAPAARRAFVDRSIFGVDRGYYAEALAYQRVLRSRNAILRQGLADGTLLDTYDDQLARLGARLVVRRRDVVSALRPRVEALFERIHGPLSAEIRYHGHAEVEKAEGESGVESALAEGLRTRRGLDQRRRFTGFGPHTDDLAIRLDGRLAVEHGSQGQLRSLVLAMKLAELAYVHEALGEAPILLLDDVASELDQRRRQQLFETIAGLPGQTFITVTDRTFVPQLPGREDFSVVAGRLAPGGPGAP